MANIAPAGNQIRRVNHAKAGPVQGIHRVAVVAKAENLPGPERKEIGAAGPLLALLHIRLAAAAADGSKINAHRRQRAQHVAVFNNFGLWPAGKRTVKGPATVEPGNQRRIHHAFVVVDHGKDHVQMNGGPGFWNLNHDEIVDGRSEEHTSELQSRGHLVCRLLLEKKKRIPSTY